MTHLIDLIMAEDLEFQALLDLSDIFITGSNDGYRRTRICNFGCGSEIKDTVCCSILLGFSVDI